MHHVGDLSLLRLHILCACMLKPVHTMIVWHMRRSNARHHVLHQRRFSWWKEGIILKRGKGCLQQIGGASIGRCRQPSTTLSVQNDGHHVPFSTQLPAAVGVVRAGACAGGSLPAIISAMGEGRESVLAPLPVGLVSNRIHNTNTLRERMRPHSPCYRTNSDYPLANSSSSSSTITVVYH